MLSVIKLRSKSTQRQSQLPRIVAFMQWRYCSVCDCKSAKVLRSQHPHLGEIFVHTVRSFWYHRLHQWRCGNFSPGGAVAQLSRENSFFRIIPWSRLTFNNSLIESKHRWFGLLCNFGVIKWKKQQERKHGFWYLRCNVWASLFLRWRNKKQITKSGQQQQIFVSHHHRQHYRNFSFTQ